jgi:hypothetical protein
VKYRFSATASYRSGSVQAIILLLGIVVSPHLFAAIGLESCVPERECYTHQCVVGQRGPEAELCFVEIGPVGSSITPADQTNLAALVEKRSESD